MSCSRFHFSSDDQLKGTKLRKTIHESRTIFVKWLNKNGASPIDSTRPTHHLTSMHHVNLNDVMIDVALVFVFFLFTLVVMIEFTTPIIWFHAFASWESIQFLSFSCSPVYVLGINFHQTLVTLQFVNLCGRALAWRVGVHFQTIRMRASLGKNKVRKCLLFCFNFVVLVYVRSVVVALVLSLLILMFLFLLLLLCMFSLLALFIFLCFCLFLFCNSLCVFFFYFSVRMLGCLLRFSLFAVAYARVFKPQIDPMLFRSG